MGSISAYFLAGAVAFAAAQAALFMAAGQLRPTIDSSGWFLNSTTGIAVVAIVMAVASAAVGRAMPSLAIWKGWVTFVGGAALMLVAAVFLLGPGTIFPIVIAMGIAIIMLGALAGTAVTRRRPQRQRVG